MPYSIADKTKYPELAVIEPIHDMEGLSDGQRDAAKGAVFAALGLFLERTKNCDGHILATMNVLRRDSGKQPYNSSLDLALEYTLDDLTPRLKKMGIPPEVIDQVQAKFRAHCEKQIGAAAVRSA